MQQLVWIWIALSAVVLLVTWNSKRPSVGLPLGYWLSITLLHFSGALAYAQPGYRPTAQMLLDNFHGFHTTFIGFVEAVIGLAGLVFGLILSQFWSGCRTCHGPPHSVCFARNCPAR